MGYGNPLHGLDNNGEPTAPEPLDWGTNVGRPMSFRPQPKPPVRTALTEASVRRVVASETAVEVLKEAGIHFTPKELIDLADWYLEADEPVYSDSRPLSEAEQALLYRESTSEAFRLEEEAIAQKVRSRMATFQAALEEVLQQFGPKPDAMVRVSDLKPNDVIAPCGDFVTETPPVYDESLDQWTVTADCPKHPDDPFTYTVAGRDTEVPVFKITPFAERHVPVVFTNEEMATATAFKMPAGVKAFYSGMGALRPATALRNGDIIAPDGDRLVGAPFWSEMTNRWYLRIQCPSQAQGDTFVKWIRGLDAQILVF
jgi:hypothetical protein